ncbi:helix-turn-helix transcriptional regulator [Paenibacillus albidus]|uniref:helix-turn-helix domain-containing protein n=1 Tax=Paenibacillus albidus TaxID=2041023 RepID=UPI001BE5FBDF|nr:AraC family transcriptional regulator [Paenibacillus albidus]MBT2290836.1 helix-turn-helix transcriptional regulator [Paenibacillus albidus]
MNTPNAIPGRLLENLTVTVTHAHYRNTYYGWNRTEQSPSFNRLYFLDSGEGSVTLNGVIHYPKPHQLMIMPAGTTQSTVTVMDNPYARYFCHFDARIGEWPLFHAANKLYISDAPDPDEVRRIFAEMIRLYQNNDFLSTLRIHASLLQLLAICLESGGYTDFMNEFFQTSEQGKLAHVLNYIDERLPYPMEVEELAELVHLHPNYFIPYFKKFTGVPPMHYVQFKRMEFAKRLLTYSDSGISDIAEQVGMELAHFSKYFKKSTGVTPSAYRKSTQ